MCSALLFWLTGFLDAHLGSLLTPSTHISVLCPDRLLWLPSLVLCLRHNAVNAPWLWGAQLAGACWLLARPARSLDGMHLLAADPASAQGEKSLHGYPLYDWGCLWRHFTFDWPTRSWFIHSLVSSLIDLLFFFVVHSFIHSSEPEKQKRWSNGVNISGCAWECHFPFLSFSWTPWIS